MLGPIAQYVELLGRYLRPLWPRVLLLGVLLLGGHGLELLFPQILRHFIDSALEQRALRGLYETGALLLLVGLVAEAAVAGTYYVGTAYHSAKVAGS
jgi:ABC-type multidrug transport system fused ATPase/permease subunit